MNPTDIIVIDEEVSQEADGVVVEQEEHPVSDDKFKDRVSRDGDNIVVTLLKPFKCTFRGSKGDRTEVFSSLTFRPANGGDLRALSSFRDEEEKTLQLFLRMSGLVQAQFDLIEYNDITFCMEAIESFLLSGPKIGKN